MSASLPAIAEPTRRPVEIGLWLALFGAAAALVIGLAVGFSTSGLRLLATGMIGVGVIAAAFVWPFVAVQGLLVSSVFLVGWLVTDLRAVNPIDLLMPPVLVASLAGSTRRRALLEDAAGHFGIRRATRRLVRTALVFYGIALLSVILMAFRGQIGWATESSLLLFRGVQGLAFFALCQWWLRTEKQVRSAERSLLIGATLLIGVNIFYIVTRHIARAGMTWILNMPEWPISAPNEAAVSLLIVWALALARRGRERGVFQKLMLAVAPMMLVLTQSRSGLLAWTAFVLMTLRWRQWRTVAATVVVVALVVVLTPAEYWGRISRTLHPGGGSFEAFSSLIRVYGWYAASRVFLSHPLMGVGYLAYRHVSSFYNDFHIVLITAESIFLEIAADLGVVGLIAMVAVFIALARVGPAVRAGTPEGSHGHEMGRCHVPMVIALLVTNLTGIEFVGMTGLAQVSIWTALVIRSGQLSAAAAAAEPAAEPPRRPAPA